MTKGYEYNKRWRMTHAGMRGQAKKRNYAQTQGAPNHRKPWTLADMALLTEFDGTDRELSAKIGRSVQAIQHMRHRTKEDKP